MRWSRAFGFRPALAAVLLLVAAGAGALPAGVTP